MHAEAFEKEMQAEDYTDGKWLASFIA